MTIRWLSDDYPMTIQWLSRAFDLFFLMIIDLKRSIDRRWLFKSGATFILDLVFFCFCCCNLFYRNFFGRHYLLRHYDLGGKFLVFHSHFRISSGAGKNWLAYFIWPVNASFYCSSIQPCIASSYDHSAQYKQSDGWNAEVSMGVYGGHVVELLWWSIYG